MKFLKGFFWVMLVIIFATVLFLIHPVLGVVWLLWLVGIIVFKLKFDKHRR